MNDLINFVAYWHGDQKRKFTFIPYVVHPIRCYLFALEHFPTNIVLQKLMLCHDLLEDTECTFDILAREVGKITADHVVELTNVYERTDYPALNRRMRKVLEFKRISNITHTSKVGKLIDRYDNLGEMSTDNDFIDTYCKESVQLVDTLRGTDPDLENLLDNRIACLYDDKLQGKLNPAINRVRL